MLSTSSVFSQYHSQTTARNSNSKPIRSRTWQTSLSPLACTLQPTLPSRTLRKTARRPSSRSVHLQSVFRVLSHTKAVSSIAGVSLHRPVMAARPTTLTTHCKCCRGRLVYAQRFAKWTSHRNARGRMPASTRNDCCTANLAASCRSTAAFSAATSPMCGR